MAKSTLRRVSPEDVKENARKSGGGGRGIGSLLRLPKGVETWEPDKAGSFNIDIIPYIISDKNHPDEGSAKFVPGETLWYKREIRVHQNVGPDNEMVVCPTSYGIPCPICQERARLVNADYEGNKAEITALNYKKFVAFNILDPDDSDSVKIFCFSTGKFWAADAGLKREIDESEDPKIINFYDIVDGSTLRVRFSDDVFVSEGGRKNKYLNTTKIEFVPREDIDEAKFRKMFVDLDAMIVPLPYDKIKALFFGADADGVDKPPKASAGGARSGTAGENEDDDEKPVKTGSGKKATKPEPEDDDDNTPTFKVGDQVKGKTVKGIKVVGVISDIDDENIEVTDDEADTHDCKASALELIEPDPEDAEDAQTEEPEGDENEDADKTQDDDDAPVAVGDTVKNESGDIGQVLKVDTKDQEITVQYKSGKVICDYQDIMKVTVKGGGKASKKETPAEAASPEVGDTVIWEDGESGDVKEGEVVKIKDDSSKVRVKDEDDNLIWIPIDNVTVPPPVKAGKKK